MLYAGVARENITPALGGKLFGYNDRTFSRIVHDELDATALAFKSESTTAMLISLAVCLISSEIAREIRDKIQAATGIPADHVIISCTHTHTGPATSGRIKPSKWGSIDLEYCNNILIPRCVAVAKAAVLSMVPVKVGVGTTESKVGINRRQLLRDNTVILGQNPWEVYDPTMTVIAFRDESGKPFANIVHVGAHCTAAGPCDEISRDWAGVMVDRMEAESGAMTIFVNGTQGDIAPRMANGASSGNMQHAMEVGGLAAIDAVRAYKSIRTFYDEPLSVGCGDLSVPFMPPIPENEIPARIEACDDEKHVERSSLERLADMYKAGDLGPEAWIFRQGIVRIGPVVMVPFPFEVSSEIGLRLRNYSPYAHTLLLSCTNGSNGYLVAQSQICRGGYEVTSFRWSRPRQMPDDADRRLIEQNLNIIEHM